MHAKLKVVRGPFAGEKIEMPLGKLLIGRAKDCHLRLDSQSVSQHHCVLLLDEYTLRIRDLGSHNGTVVNGRRIGTHESILLHDDTVSIDQLTFEIDLTETAVGVIVAPAQPPFSEDLAEELFTPEMDEAGSGALEGTCIFEGDTEQVVPRKVSQPSSRQQPVRVDVPGPVEEADADTPLTREPSDPTGSQYSTDQQSTGSLEQSTPTTSPNIASPSATPRSAPWGAGARQAPTLSNRSTATPKRVASAKQDAPTKLETSPQRPRAEKAIAKKMTTTGLRRGPIIAGLIALAVLGGGAYFLFGRNQPTQYEAPQKYVDFAPESYATLLACEVPENWKQKFKGGKKTGPMWARFTDGPLSIEITENLTGGAIREAVVAMRRKPSRIPTDASVAEQIHEYQRERAAEAFKSYTEDPRSRGIKTQGLGQARISNFTATEGILGADVAGCRATAVNQAYQFTVICKCPPSLLHDAQPVFEKVIASLRSGVAADAQ
jgi:FHA domain